ncbi:hypothetical protein [Pistricoccus aurantiacus]|uniref:hypothetical protein n=1 Tax=Pistricoccus aurantiacus TaxID=1883414 RepID=UPI00363C0BC3
MQDMHAFGVVAGLLERSFGLGGQSQHPATLYPDTAQIIFLVIRKAFPKRGKLLLESSNAPLAQESEHVCSHGAFKSVEYYRHPRTRLEPSRSHLTLSKAMSHYVIQFRYYRRAFPSEVLLASGFHLGSGRVLLEITGIYPTGLPEPRLYGLIEAIACFQDRRGGLKLYSSSPISRSNAARHSRITLSVIDRNG